MQAAGVELRERTAFTGLRTDRPDGGHASSGSRRTSGDDRDRARAADRRPHRCARSGRWPGCASRPAPRAIPSPCSSPTTPSTSSGCRWSSTSAAGLYWRLEEGGLLFGWSDPDEAPGEARAIDWAAYERYRERLAATCRSPAGSACARSGPPRSTTRPTTCRSSGRRIRPDGTRDRGRDRGLGGRPRDDVGTRRGPRRGRSGRPRRQTTLIDVTDLGLDRFDEHGRSRLAPDPIALPYPATAEDR